VPMPLALECGIWSLKRWVDDVDRQVSVCACALCGGSGGGWVIGHSDVIVGLIPSVEVPT
jgi:hypothetical protein